MIAIIPAAGYATRLGELTKEKPKHLLEIGGEPMINYVIRGIESLLITDILLVTNDKFYNQFIDWQRNFETKIRIKILNDGTRSNEDRLGAVGDIWYVIEKCGIDDDLLIVAGDNLYYEKGAGYNLKPFNSVFEGLGKNAGVVGLYDVKSLTIAQHMNQITFVGGKIPLSNEKAQMIKIVEKDPEPTSTLIAIMIEAYPRVVIACLQDYIKTRENHDRWGDFRGWLVKENKMPVYGYHLPGQWFDVGLVEELEKARRFYENIT